MRRVRLSRALLLLACVGAGASPAVAEPERSPLVTVVVIPGSHLDVGFTAPPSVVTAKRIATLDAAIEASEKDPDFRWTEECGYVVHAWLQAHGQDPARVSRLKALLQSKHIGMGACWVNAHAALFPEALPVLFAWLEEAQSAFGMRPTWAVVNDVPSVPEALVDAGVRAGVTTFVCGPNLAFSPPLPPTVIGTWIRSTSGGSRASFFVDPDSYTAAFTRWGIDAVTAKFFAKERFGTLEGQALTRQGIDAMSRGTFAAHFAPRGIVLVQHAFDNWGIEAATRLPAFAAEWNTAKQSPSIGLGALGVGMTEALLRGAPGPSAPSRDGEWDGQWEEVRAQVPQWTARLRIAAKNLGKNETLERRLALATTMDHTGAMGPPWPGLLTEEETVQHDAEWQDLFKAGIGPREDRRALAMLSGTNELRIEEGTKRPEKIPAGVDAAGLDPAVRRGPHSLAGAWFAADAPVARSKTGIEGDETSVTLWAKVDRGVLPGDDEGIVVVGWDVPLTAARKDVTLVPLDPDGVARRTKRLLGRDPDTWIAPDGVELRGPGWRLAATSTHAFSWRLVERDGKARLQAMLVRQSRKCEFKGGATKVLPFDVLYPGEPRYLDAELVLSTRAP